METIRLNNSIYDVVEIFTESVLLQNQETKTLILLPFFVIEHCSEPDIKLTGKVISLRGFRCRKKINMP